jgi:hypothetical protein
MSKLINKNINTYITLDEYMTKIQSNCEKSIIYNKKLSKIEDDEISIPSFHQYDLIIKYNYNIQQLKNIAKIYKLKISGIKKELVTRIYVYLKLSFIITKIQKLFRGIIQRKYNQYHGPAFIKRELCTNNTDFFTMDELKDIPYSHFFSFKDNDGFIYGFDIVSLYNLIIKSNNVVKNPYNRNDINVSVIQNIKTLIRLSKVLNIEIDLNISDISSEISIKKTVELRTLELFQNIDYLGNYSNPEWFSLLNRHELIKFMRELSDIWNFRTQITNEIKRSICPPHGDPFRNFGISYILNEPDLYNVKKYILNILEKFVNTGVDRDSRSLGAYYVLGALTIVNYNAAEALPWLYQSFSYF